MCGVHQDRPPARAPTTRHQADTRGGSSHGPLVGPGPRKGLAPWRELARKSGEQFRSIQMRHWIPSGIQERRDDQPRRHRVLVRLSHRQARWRRSRGVDRVHQEHERSPRTQGDPLNQIRLLARLRRRLTKASKGTHLRERRFVADEAHISVRSRLLPSKKCEVFHQPRPRPTPGAGPSSAYRPVPSEIARLGRTYAGVEGRILGLPRYYRRSRQRLNRSHQRNHRTGQTHRQRLPQPPTTQRCS